MEKKVDRMTRLVEEKIGKLFPVPDFIIEYKNGSKEIHETKGLPLLLWLSTKLKGQSAEEFCKANGLKYKLITKGSQAFYGKI
ncbi:MAG: hypothetical protein AABY78_05945 [Nitrospirota bacterium]